MNKKILTKEDILHLAKLAKLQLTEEEINKYWNQLEETVEYVKNLKELNTEKVAPTTQITKTINRYFDDGSVNKRLLEASVATTNARNKQKNYFVVKRIM